EHNEQIFEMFAEAIAKRRYAEWIQILESLSGPWAPGQNGGEIGHDAALIAIVRNAAVNDADGKTQKLVANPVKFDDAPVQMQRAPQFAEHTDDILRELGLDDDQLIELKIAGAVT